MANRFPVSREILNWLPKYSGKGYEAFYTRFPKYDEWVAGTLSPTFNQITDLAAFSNVPLGYMYLQAPPNIAEKEIADFRRVNGVEDSTPYSSELRDTIYDMQIRQDWLSEYRKFNLAMDQIPYIGAFSQDMNVKQLVEKAYSLLGIKKGWQIREADPFAYIRSHLEAIGITVFVNGVVGSNNNRKLLVSEFRGFTLLDSYAPIIFINGRDSSNGKLFTIIHEFCHVLLGEEGVSDGNSEPYCNRFAAEFLVPESLFHSRWSESPQAYEQIAKYFKVSQYVIYRVALTHSYIDREQYEVLVEEFEQQLQNMPERRTQGGGNFYATAHTRLGESFSRTVVQAARAGSLAYREAYELLGLRGNTFSKYVNEYGF